MSQRCLCLNRFSVKIMLKFASDIFVEKSLEGLNLICLMLCKLNLKLLLRSKLVLCFFSLNFRNNI